MFKSILTISIFLPTLISANDVYSPNSNTQDWTGLTPDTEQLEGSYDSVPFNFGMVLNPFVINHEGDYEPPTISTVQRELTTTYVTSHVTQAPKPTKAIDVYQIDDGQIQKAAEDDNEVDASTLATKTLDSSSMKRKREEQENEDESDAEAYEADDCGDEDDEDEDEEESNYISPVYAVSCLTERTLSMSLKDGILRDSNDRIGSIVGSRQFQFDGPLPQYGTIYAAGWSITNKGQLSLGNSTKFYQCLSGEFYNLYDEPIGYQCNPVSLDVVELIEC